jgi:hypothetical protein
MLIGALWGKVFVYVEFGSASDQKLGELDVDAPDAPFVRIGQRRTAHRLAKAHVVGLADLRRQAGLDVAQTLPVGELSKGHHSKLLGSGEYSGSMIAPIPMHDAFESRPRQKIHHLNKHRLAGLHGRSSKAVHEKLADTLFCIQVDTTFKIAKLSMKSICSALR